MSAAEDAYKAAEAAIAEAKRTGAEWLSFEGETFDALHALPPGLAKLNGLRALNLNYTEVIDLSPLEGMPELKHLFLEQTPIKDIANLQGLTALESLSLRSTRVRDIAPLASLSKLQSLHLSKTRVNDIAPLADIADLKVLTLDSTDVGFLGPLAGLKTLMSLSLGITPISDITPLMELCDLRSLSLDYTFIVDVGPLLWMSRLTSLTLSHTRVESIVPLVFLTGLQTLAIHNTWIRDLRPLKQLHRLAEAPVLTGLTFHGIPATADKGIARIAMIPDPKARASELFALLDAGWEPPEAAGKTADSTGSTNDIPPETGPAHPFVFLSYASADRNIVSKLHDFLTHQGIPLWWDQDIPAGAKWRKDIEGRLEVARAVVTFWTKESIQRDTVIEEASTAQATGRLLQVRLDDTPLRLGFSETQYVDLHDWDGSATHPQMAKLLRALHERLTQSG